jgi:hypothetical protein
MFYEDELAVGHPAISFRLLVDLHPAIKPVPETNVGPFI